MTFELHAQLDADTVDVHQLDLCRVLLMDDATYPWLILVPARPGLRDLHDISPDEDALLMAEVRQTNLTLQALHRPDKINVAALGNQVPQLHIHVIARFTDDPAWPGPVWGKAPRQPYGDAERVAVVDAFRQALENTL